MNNEPVLPDSMPLCSWVPSWPDNNSYTKYIVYSSRESPGGHGLSVDHIRGQECHLSI